MKTFTRILLAALMTVACLFSSEELSAQSETYMNALRAMQDGDLSKAAKLFTQEIAANPDNDAAYY